MDSKLILVDVDGVLNPLFLNEPPRGFSRYKITDATYVYLNPEMGQWLIDLSIETGAQLCWGTLWEDNANTYISPLLGLPQLPVMKIRPWKFSSTVAQDKAYSVRDFANGRKFAFLEDAPLGGSLRSFGVKNGKHIPVNYRTGLTQRQVGYARKYLNEE